ncbi:MAG: phosphatase PAP2 family protein [Gemmataceae bacterium]
MTFRKLLNRSLIALAIGAGLVTLSYFFVDRPVAYFVHDHQINHHEFLKWLTYIPIVLETAAPGVIVLLTVRLALGPASRLEWTFFAMALNLIVTLSILPMLKPLFGRYWPDTWIENNPSLIRNNAYGFHPFHWGDWYTSCPSGHTTRIVAVMGVWWVAYPRWRALSVLVAGAVIVGLLGMNYHFVGDCIAGAFTGGITAAYAAHFFLLDEPAGAKEEAHPNGSDGPV